MKKLLNFFDRFALKFCVSFLIIFVALYPKLPSIHINHTWVYIRLEDFAIAFTVVVWILAILRRKIRFSFSISAPFIIYWVVGLISLVYSITFIGPLLLNYFPSIAALSYIRRIEYMVLFFVAFSSVRSIEDAKYYLKILIGTTLIFTLYGFGQKFYIYLWNLFPGIFTKYPFCFPSFQTGNEEFAKGIPLCLPFDGRITSTFAGHYDLAAYLVLVIPIFIAIIFTLRKKLLKVLFSLFTLSTIIILILTSSRISFPAYLLGSAITLILVKRKKFIIPLIILSMVLLPIFSSSMAKRFLQTFRVTKIVVDSQGHIVGEELSPKLQRQLTQKYVGNAVTQDLPEGSGFIGLPSDTVKEKTDTAVVRSTLTPEEARKLKLENGGVELSAVKGNFTLKRALVYDISLTTRLQSEWPNAIHAFSRNYLIGSGFATITLATDNDFLRFLGETGVLGLFSFLSIFLMLLITFRKLFRDVKDPVIKAFGAGILGGVAGLFINASLFDIFEASKVAETMWILLGISASVFLLQTKNKINYTRELKAVLSSHVFLIFYLVIIAFVFFGKSFNNFFVADDFTWLRWAAGSSSADLIKNFTNAAGFFYRPLSKDLMFLLYALFAFKPLGYHVFSFVVHSLTAAGVYLLSWNLFKQKKISFLSSLVFLILPVHAENLYWISTISTNISAMLIVYGLNCFYYVRQKKSLFVYLLSLLFFGFALFNYEGSIIFTGLILLIDILYFRLKMNIRSVIFYLPYLVLSVFYLFARSYSHAISPNGDYSYSFIHLVPNFIGNFFGYFAASIIGESTLPYYLKLRLFFRQEILVSAVLIVITLAIVAFVFYKKGRSIQKLAGNTLVRDLAFGLMFFIIALLPYLGLGNISGRYAYLPSVGIVFSLVILIDLFAKRINRGFFNYKKIIFIITVLLGLFYYKELSHSSLEWQKAGKITNRTLAYLKIYHETVPAKSNLLFVNTPIKFEDAWVFPVGLPDGIWFVYGEDSLSVSNVSTVDEALKLKKVDKNSTYIFEFKNFVMEEVKK